MQNTNRESAVSDSLPTESVTFAEDTTFEDYTGVPDSIEIITLDSKTSLQMDLLRHQIEYTKRDILLLELKILEKKRSLMLTEAEKSCLSANCKNSFENRKTID